MTNYSQHIVLDLYAGHGVGVAIKTLGAAERAVEINKDAIATRRANGMDIAYEDVWDLHRAYDLNFDTEWGSPPCQAFSAAGKGEGRKQLDLVLAAIAERRYEDIDELREWAQTLTDERAGHVLVPLAYAHVFRPTFIALEQVPTVLPVWQAYARVLREWGYSVEVDVLNAERYGRYMPCAMHSADEVARSAESLSRYETEVGRAGGDATTKFDYEGTPLARIVVAYWALAISQGDASLATLLARAQQEAMRGGSERKMPTGKAAGLWTSVGMSEFGLTESIAESIELLWKESLEDLSRMEKWFTMSMGQQITTIRATLSCIRATRSTCIGTGRGTIHPDCGLCLDEAVPQTRRRAILVARKDGHQVSLPTPTHSRYHSRTPKRLDPGVKKWVSMAEALDFGMTDRPYPTTAPGSGAGGGVDPGFLGGSGSRRIVREEFEAGRWKTAA